MDDTNQLYLIRITSNTGAVVAEAPLAIYDNEKAMALFLDAMSGNGFSWPGIMLKGMMIATGTPEGAHGTLINIVEQGGAPKLIVPNGMPKDGRW